LFNNIEKGSYYSNQTIHYLSTIKICGIVAGVLFGLMLPSIFYFVQMDDAPGLALVGLVFILASVSVAIFASVMKDLVKRKID